MTQDTKIRSSEKTWYTVLSREGCISVTKKSMKEAVTDLSYELHQHVFERDGFVLAVHFNDAIELFLLMQHGYFLQSTIHHSFVG